MSAEEVKPSGPELLDLIPALADQPAALLENLGSQKGIWTENIRTLAASATTSCRTATRALRASARGRLHEKSLGSVQMVMKSCDLTLLTEEGGAWRDGLLGL